MVGALSDPTAEQKVAARLVHSHCRLRHMNSKKPQYCKQASVKIGSLWYDFMPSGMIFSPVEFCELLAATCLRFLVVCGCH